MRDKEALENMVSLLKENIQEAESMKGWDLDYLLANIGGVGKKSADAVMDVLKVATGKAGETFGSTYDSVTSGIEMMQSEGDYKGLQKSIDMLKAHSSLKSEDRLLFTISQSIADIKNGNEEEALNRILNLNPFHSAVENLKEARQNIGRNNEALSEKNLIIDNQIKKWEEELSKAEKELKNIEGNEYESSTLNKTQEDNVQIDFNTSLQQIHTHINRLNNNLR